MHIKKAIVYMEELIDAHPHAFYVEAWSCIEKALDEALKPSHNKQSAPCHIPNCPNNAVINLCEMHWDDLPK